MLWYTLVLGAVSILPVAFGAFGTVYLVAATALWSVLLVGVLAVRRPTATTKAAWSVYKYSLLYLALLFLAMVIDRRVHF
jgi:protoheme IX farnesyltransferase